MIDNHIESSCNSAEEYENFIEDCSRCKECTVTHFCPDHGSEWDQVYKYYHEQQKVQKQ